MGNSFCFNPLKKKKKKKFLFQSFFFFWWTRNFIERKKTDYKALLDSSKIMEEKQAGLLPISKGPKKLQNRDHFVKEWVAALHNLGIHFTKNLPKTDNKFLKSEHKDLILPGGLSQIIEKLHTILAIRFHNDALITHDRS